SIRTLSDQFGNSTYNALQINLQKQIGEVVFLGNYTFSKMLTNTDFGQDSFGSGDYQHPDLRDKEGKLLSASDRPQVVNLSWVYQLPFGKGKRFLAKPGGVLNQIV